jgi:hypothetical protein
LKHNLVKNSFPINVKSFASEVKFTNGWSTFAQKGIGPLIGEFG